MQVIIIYLYIASHCNFDPFANIVNYYNVSTMQSIIFRISRLSYIALHIKHYPYANLVKYYNV